MNKCFKIVVIILYKRVREPKEGLGRPWWDSNPQSPAPEADALSIRPQGRTYARVNYWPGIITDTKGWSVLVNEEA